jgi:hypothetical protein
MISTRAHARTHLALHTFHALATVDKKADNGAAGLARRLL